MVLSIAVLAGINFSYDKPNIENELIILVDSSFSNQAEQDAKDEFISQIIDEATESVNLGIVKFGYDQKVAVELSPEHEDAFDKYLTSEDPDTSATNIEGALQFARGLFNHPESGKIVLVTDGVQTDGSAESVIKSIAADGIKVDTVYFPNSPVSTEVQIVNIKTPDYNVIVGEPFTISFSLQSSYEGVANVTIYDNDEKGNTLSVKFDETDLGEVQDFSIQHTFMLPGLHKLYIEIEAEGDIVSQNNRYYSYMNLQVFDKVLILYSQDDEYIKLQELLAEDYTVDVKNITIASEAPTTVDQLRMYDQVIMLNVAHSDMPEGFEGALQSYVYDYGGGMLTVGGKSLDTNEAHSYDRQDMKNTVYQEMIPVEAIDYTPPLAVMIIIDRSGSMSSNVSSSSMTKLELAKEGAKSALYALTERDYCGIMTLENSYTQEAEITPLPQRQRILAAIDDIPMEGGGTVFTGALERAGQALLSVDVEKRHIILITDGEPGDSLEEYGAVIQRLYSGEKSVTTSIVGIEISPAAEANMEAAVSLCTNEDGVVEGRIYNVGDDLSDKLRDDLMVPEIKAYNPEPFKPVVKDRNTILSGVKDDEIPLLGGFYGTKLKNEQGKEIEVPLMGEYTPVYAQWKYGEGTVGSFMCDLKGTADSWSSEFMSNKSGIRLIKNIVNTLMPTQDIRPTEIALTMREDNYTTQMSIFTGVEEGQKINVQVTSPPTPSGESDVQLINPNPDQGYSRVEFYNLIQGIHEITVSKTDAEGVNVVAPTLAYRVFSYSKEYNAFVDADACEEMLVNLAKNGRGSVVQISEPWEVYDDFDPFTHIVVDPRLPFIIIALIALLLDIAVRKFKFKWPHEIVADYKRKKALKRK